MNNLIVCMNTDLHVRVSPGHPAPPPKVGWPGKLYLELLSLVPRPSHDFLCYTQQKMIFIRGYHYHGFDS